jgi:glutamyl-tRNA reductase
VATGAQKYIIDETNFPKDKEMLVIDLSIPNNVQKEIGKLENVTLIDVDQLSQTIKQTMEQRKKKFRKPKALSKKWQRICRLGKKENWLPISISSKTL